MSLGRLLAAGKSLIGLRNGESRYRENKQVRLPKFISPKNPFAPAEPVEEPVAKIEAPKPAPVVSESAPVLVLAPVPKRETEAPLVAVAPKPQTLSAPKGAAKSSWLAEWGQKIKPFSGRRSTVKPGAAGTAGTARQPELALERVQVVRNDLAEATREVEPPQSKLALPALPGMAVTMEKLEPFGAACNRLATKFLGSDKT